MSTGKRSLVVNKASHAHGDVLAATGRVVRAESGYQPRIAETAHTPPRKAHTTTTNMKASLSKPSEKG
jgi:hypothetical protein